MSFQWRGNAVLLACGLLVLAAGCNASAVTAGGGTRTLSFGAASVYSSEDSGLVAVGDLNGDGKADIVVTSTSRFSVLMNQGDGTFAASVSYAINAPVSATPRGGPSALAIGDLNGDGASDLVLVDSSTPVTEAGPGDSGGLSIFLNSGSGVFSPPAYYQGVIAPGSIALLDLDGAPGTDLVVTAGGAGEVFILPNNGDGTFAAAREVTGAPPDASSWSASGTKVVVGDLNGDGFADLALGGNGSVYILPGSRDGAFTSTYGYPSGGYWGGEALGDINGDGKLDLAVADEIVDGPNGSITNGPVSVLMNNGDGTLAAPVVYAANGPSAVAFADLDGDGKLDLVVADSIAGSNGDSVGVRLNAGNGVFTDVHSLWTGSLDAFALGDLDGDGTPDLVVSNQDGLSVLLNNSY
jgi:FG-GAP-like repeat